jgi:probable rRNA maturation factor
MIDIEVEDEHWARALPDVEALAHRAALAGARASSRQGQEDRRLEARAADGRSFTILLADDDAVADLNARFRGIAGPTNVLSFPSAPNPEAHLGDIALAFGVCAREAATQGKPLADHLSHLVIHGVLHLLGYDHQESVEAERMESLERVLMESLGAPDPYAIRAVPGDRGGHVQHRQ